MMLVITASIAVFWMSLFVVIYSYVVYPVLLRLLSMLFRRPHVVDEKYFPRLAVVVPVYNEELVIERKLRNLLSLNYPRDRIEIWVGSDESSDRTDDIVRSFPDSRVHLWRAQRRGGKSEVLNNLTPVLECEVVVFTDANTLHRPESLANLARHFADPEVGAVAGHVEHTVPVTDEMEETFYRLYEVGQKQCESQLHSAISAFGGFYAVRHSLFRKIPYNAYSNDDVLIPMNIIRQKHRVVFDREAISDEDMTESIAKEFSRRVRIGAGNFQAFFLLLDFLNPLKGWPWFCYCSHKVTRWFSPLCIFAGYVACGIAAFAADILLYRVLFGAGIAILAIALSFKIVPFPLTRHFFYFLSMNVALFMGFFRFARGIHSAAWNRTDRS